MRARVLVCGGRDFTDWRGMYAALSALHDKHGFSAIIEGGARGADAGGRSFGEQNSIPVLTYPADWKKHGKAAGYIRNRKMLDEGKPDLVVAFPGGKGTAMMIRIAEAAGVRVIRAGWGQP